MVLIYDKMGQTSWLYVILYKEGALLNFSPDYTVVLVFHNF